MNELKEQSDERKNSGEDEKRDLMKQKNKKQTDEKMKE
jgi:hypothetical protein